MSVSKTFLNIIVVCASVLISCQKKDGDKSVDSPTESPIKTQVTQAIDPFPTSIDGKTLTFEEVTRANFTNVTPDSTSIQIYSYRRIENSCDTYNRIFGSKEELCINLQIAGNNNHCSKNSLQKLFAESCPGQTWNDRVGDVYFLSTGHTVNCFYSEENPTPSQILAREKYISEQMTPKPTMLMAHEHSQAIIFHSYLNGKLDIKIAIYDIDGKLLGEKLVTSQDKSPDSVQLEIKENKFLPRVTCYPNILNNK